MSAQKEAGAVQTTPRPVETGDSIPSFNSSSIPAPLRVYVSVYQTSTVRVAQELATYYF